MKLKTKAKAKHTPVPLEGGNGFATREFVKTYLETGNYPKIHEDIYKVVEFFIPEEERTGGLIDFGACTGMLTTMMHDFGYSPAIGLEAREQDIAVFDGWLKKEGRWLQQFFSEPQKDECLAELGALVKQYGVKTILARRALPEFLGGTDKHNGHDMNPDNPARLCDALINNGVTRIIIEGRTFSSRTKHLLGDIDKEVKVMSCRFTETTRYNNVSIMEVDPKKKT